MLTRYADSDKQIPIYYYTKSHSDELSWEGFSESIGAFISAVDWSQSWLLAILSFHIMSFFLLIKFRNKSNTLTIITFSLMILAGFSQQINNIAHDHWEKFSRDDYFDESGFFISMIFSFPVLVNAIMGVVLILNEVLHILRKLKIAQIKQMAKSPESETKRDIIKDSDS